MILATAQDRLGTVLFEERWGARVCLNSSMIPSGRYHTVDTVTESTVLRKSDCSALALRKRKGESGASCIELEFKFQRLGDFRRYPYNLTPA